MKLKVHNESGLMLLRPSKRHQKVALVQGRLDWTEQQEKGPRLYPSEFWVAPGAHEVERIPNPFVPDGEPWLVLKGSRIGAAEAYFKAVAADTRNTAEAIELVADQPAAAILELAPESRAA